MTGLTNALPNTLAGDAVAGTVRDDGRGALAVGDALSGTDRDAQPASPITATASAARANS
jgi:hypothetical protein